MRPLFLFCRASGASIKYLYDKTFEMNRRSRPFTSNPGALGKTGILKAFTTSCVMNASTANSSAICRRRALSWRAGVSSTMNVVRTERLATGPPTSMPIERRTDLMGAAHPQTPHRSPRQAFEGATKDQRHKVANKRKTEHQGTRRTSSYEVSPTRGHANLG